VGSETVQLVTYYPLVLLAIGVIFSIVAMRRLPPPATPGQVVEALLAWFVFFNIGVAYLWRSIEYAALGGQVETAAASLGFAAVGFAAAFKSLAMRFLAVLGASIFVLGDVFEIIRGSTVATNFLPGNVDVTTYANVTILVIGFILLWMQMRLGQPWTRERRKSPYIR
jgi:hypothetical protein